MKQGSVKKRIFISNAFMVLVSLLVFLAINLVIIKGYSEAIEKEIRTSVEQIVDEDGLEDLIIDWTFQRNEFLLFFGLDGILCIIVLVIISQIFTKILPIILWSRWMPCRKVRKESREMICHRTSHIPEI